MTTLSYESLSHSKRDCKDHIVFIPKGMKKELYGKIRGYLGALFHELAAQRNCQIVEGHMVQDQVHMLIRIPPKYSVAEVTGYLKGKGAISVVRQFSGMQRNFNGENFWAKGYAVSTVGFEGSQIRAYIKNQEQLEAKEVMGKVSFRRWRWQPLELLQTSSLGTTWQSLGLLTTVKPPASRGRYDLR